jgi:hypothetical protein
MSFQALRDLPSSRWLSHRLTVAISEPCGLPDVADESASVSPGGTIDSPIDPRTTAASAPPKARPYR